MTDKELAEVYRLRAEDYASATDVLRAEIARLRAALEAAAAPIASPADMPTDPVKRATYWMEIAQNRVKGARAAPA